MIFYGIQAKLPAPLKEEESQNIMNQAAVTAVKFAQRGDSPALVFVCEVLEDALTLAAITPPGHYRKSTVKELIEEYLSMLSVQSDQLDINEIKSQTAYERLRTADQQGFVRDFKTLADELGINWPFRSRGKEVLPAAGKDNSRLIHEAGQLPFGRVLQEELTRIMDYPTQTRVVGHPVHYIIISDAVEQNLKAAELLVQALYSAGRIESRRCLIEELSSFEPVRSEKFEEVHNTCSGGVHVIDYASGDKGALIPCESFEDDISSVCQGIHQHRHEVLTIVCFTYQQMKVKDFLERQLSSISFISIQAECLNEESAFTYLLEQARQRGIYSEDGLKQLARDHGDQPLSQLLTQFENWFDDHLKTITYPQYAFKTQTLQSDRIVQPVPEGAYRQLQDMIGLKEVKLLIEQILTSHRAHQLLSRQGIHSQRPGLHMIFSGNPGTAKTSVARLLTRILKEEGVLSKGDLIEVGRADLVGKYVGWTSVKVREAFEKASGSILFIDEAYSLMDSRSGTFGEEAINALVLEMERRRDDTAVILAGYPDKMNELIQSNPGLRSRISFNLPFADYTPEELYQILQLLALDQGIAIHPSVRDLLLPIFSKASTETDFGNGRFVRNMLDRARMIQAGRIVQSGCNMQDERLMTLYPEDFSYQPAERIKRFIGFGC